MTREDRQAEVERLREQQETVWRMSLRDYVDLRRCDLGLCKEIDSLVEAANACKDRKKREEMEAEILHLRDCRKEVWNRVDREITQLEIAIAVLERAS